MKIQQEASLSGLHSLRLCAQAQHLVFFDHVEQLPQLLALAAQFEQIQVLAGGSNIVFAPWVPGLTICVRTQGIYYQQETELAHHLVVEAGTSWHDLVQYSLHQGWYGLENLALIPGTVGAAPVQNIGAYGVEVKQFIRWVEVWDWQQQRQYRLTAEQCQFSYRDSIFKAAGPGRWLILRVAFALPKAWQPVLSYPDLRTAPELQQQVTAQDIFSAVCRIRQSKLPDPEVLANAGSFFKNPVLDAGQAAVLKEQWPDLRAFEQPDQSVKLAAGWLLERAGWKGRRVGPLGMHRKQALVLVNYEPGQADWHDISNLKDKIQLDMQRYFGLQLEQEPVTLGVAQPAAKSEARD